MPKKCSVPRPRLVYDVKLPKPHRDLKGLQLPTIPDVERVPITIAEPDDEISLMPEPFDTIEDEPKMQFAELPENLADALVEALEIPKPSESKVPTLPNQKKVAD